MQQLSSPDVETRRRAAAGLLETEGDVTAAIPVLQEAIHDRDREVRRLAIRGLGQLGPRAATTVPALQRCLKDQELAVRLAAALAIQEIDPSEKEHRVVLIEAMRMGEGGTIVAIGQRGEPSAWAVPTLISLLEDRRPGIRRLAAEALQQIGPAAATAEKALRQTATSDSDDRVRDAAQAALAAVQGETEKE